MGRLIPFLLLADIALIAMALFDCATTAPERVRGLSKRVWIVVIVLLSPVGGIAWFANGRVPDDEPGVDRVESDDDFDHDHDDETPPRPARELPPDDNPEFLRQLEIRVREARRLKNEQPPAEE